MDLSVVVNDLVGGALTLAKEMGKGGGGSTEEPTVCMTILPIALGVLLVGVGSVRRRLKPGAARPGAAYTERAWRESGRSGRRPERKVQTA